MLHNATIPMSQLYSLSFTVIIMSPHKKKKNKQTTKKEQQGEIKSPWLSYTTQWTVENYNAKWHLKILIKGLFDGIKEGIHLRSLSIIDFVSDIDYPN